MLKISAPLTPLAQARARSVGRVQIIINWSFGEEDFDLFDKYSNYAFNVPSVGRFL